MENAIEDAGVQVGHKDESNSDRNKASKLNFVVAIDAASDIIWDLFIEDDHGTAGGHD